MLKRAALCAALSVSLLSDTLLAGNAHEQHTHGHQGHGHASAQDIGGPGKAVEATRTITVQAVDTAFREKRIAVKPGETIRFVIENRGAIPHEFTIASPGEHIAHRTMMREMPDMAHSAPNAVTVPAGETRSLVWTFGAVEDLEYACDIPGHAEQGMTGRFVVN